MFPAVLRVILCLRGLAVAGVRGWAAVARVGGRLAAPPPRKIWSMRPQRKSASNRCSLASMRGMFT